VQSLRERLREAEKQGTKLASELARREGLELYQATLPSPDGLRRMQFRSPTTVDDLIRTKAVTFAGGGHALALAVGAETGAALIAASTDSGIDAGRVLKEFLARVGGRGGGSATLAQGSFSNPSSAVQLAVDLGFS